VLARAADFDEFLAHAVNFPSKRKITLRQAARKAKPEFADGHHGGEGETGRGEARGAGIRDAGCWMLVSGCGIQSVFSLESSRKDAKGRDTTKPNRTGC